MSNLKFKSAYKDCLTYENDELEVEVRDYRTLWLPEETLEDLKDSEYCNIKTKTGEKNEQ